MDRTPPLWTCPACGRTFAHRNQRHQCGRHDLDAHFRGRPPAVRELFDQFVRLVEAIGPVTILPEKTRIAFHVRMSFAQVTPRNYGLSGHLVLARAVPHPRFRRIESLSPRNHVHHFRLSEPLELDEEFIGFLRQAYDVGLQRHLQERGPAAGS